MKKHNVTLFDGSFAHTFSRNNGDLKIFSKFINFDRNNLFDIVFYTDAYIKCRHVLNFKNKINIAWLIEPEVIDSQTYKQTLNDINLYQYIISHDQQFINTVNKHTNKGIHYFVGGTWIEEKDWSLYDKSKNISIIASNKNITYGHKLRHEIILNYRNCFDDIFGRNTNYIEYKLDGLKNYCFSVAIENATDTFTEKLIDCLVTGTIPVYYGPQQIVKSIFNPEGFLFFDNISEFESLKFKLNKFYYDSKLNAVKENFHIALQYTISEDSLYKSSKNILFNIN